MDEDQKQQLEWYESGEPLVGVIGLGYVGLPLSLAFCENDVPVIGFDIDKQKIDMIRKGESYFATLSATRVKPVVDSGRLRVTDDFSQLSECDAIIICVPTPLGDSHQPDLRYIRMTAEEISSRLHEGQLVVLESTTYPGTTDEVLREVLEKSGLKCGKEFHLAFSPEREDPGNPDFTTSQIPKLVGGTSDYSSRQTSSVA